MADALDSKSSDRKIVWVQVPPPADRLRPYFTYGKSIEGERNQLRAKTHETASKRKLFVNHLSANVAKCTLQLWAACEIFWQGHRNKKSDLGPEK